MIDLFKRNRADDIASRASPERLSDRSDDSASVMDQETASIDHVSKWQLPKSGGGDVAQALFNCPDEVREPLNPVEARRVVGKIDLLILPHLSVCYAFFYIDKTTLSYAAIFGIREDLNIVGFNIFLWGGFLMLQAAAPNFAALAALRALAGAAEAVADPAFVLVTAMWYTRRQQPIRMGIWYTANGLGIALGGLLGYAIGNVKGSLPSWKFEFLIIGALCCIWGIVIYISPRDSPVTAKGLTRREKQIAVERMREDQTGIENKRYQVYEALCDYKLYLFFVLGIVCNVPNGGISNFGTIILEGFGFSTLVTTLMQVPYGIIIAISILTCVYLNDYMARNGRQTRCYFILIFLLPNVAGSFGSRFLAPDNMAGRLTCYYPTGPYNAAFCMVLSLTTANTAGHTKKVLTNAVLFPGYCTGNIVGLFFYLAEQSSTYELGIWSMIVSHLVEFCIIILLRFLLSRENKRRDLMQSMQEGGLEGRDLGATCFGDLTDCENKNFRYIY